MDTHIDSAVDRPTPELTAFKPGKTLRQRLRRPLLLAFPLLLAAAGGQHYLAGMPYVSTDDAFVRTAKISINARVSGQVADIAVSDNQKVRKGQLLFRLDPAPYQIAVDQAEADLRSTHLQIEALKTKYRQQQAELQSARDTATFNAHEFDRKKGLLASNYASRAAYERAETDLKVARQHVIAVEQQIANTVVALDGDPDGDLSRHPALRAAQARLDHARLELSYASVLAPDDGIVTRVDELQVGDYVSPGAPVFSLLSSDDTWIEANFRETDLTHMRLGQKAVITVDAYPDRPFTAHVASMSPGTGSDFSMLPPENATGNWVKVVQRLPVRLELDGPQAARALFSGISVTARIDTGYRRSFWQPFEEALARGMEK